MWYIRKNLIQIRCIDMILHNFLGIRNTSPIRSIPNNALGDGVDVDVDDNGAISKRNGATLAKLVPSFTSAYSTFDQTPYVVSNGTLNRLDPNLTLIPLTASTATEFADFGKTLFTNDGIKVQDDRVLDLKVPTPQTAPTIRVAPGDWPEGDYAVVYSYRNLSTGLEGCISEARAITIPINSMVAVDPIPPIAGYVGVVYMTEAGGSVFYDNNGAQLNQAQLGDGFPLFGTNIAFFDSRVFVAVQNRNGSTTLYFSAPFFHHLFDYLKGYVIIPGEVRALMPSNESLIVGTDSAIYAYSVEGLTRLADYGIPKGRAFTKMPNGTVSMFTNKGVCSAMPFVNLTETKALFAPGIQCSTALVEQDGIQKFVALSDGSGAPYNVRT